MRKSFILLLSLAVIIGFSVGLSSCKKDDPEPVVPPKLSFSSPTLTVKESDGVIEIEVILDKPAPKDITVEYSLDGTAVDPETAAQNEAPDYEILTERGEIEIDEGETSGIIEIQLNSDFYFEDVETIEIQLESVDEGIELTREDEIEVTINQEDGLLIILDWGINEGENYTDVDMDLFLWAQGSGPELVLTNLGSIRESPTPPEFLFLPASTTLVGEGNYGLSCNYYTGSASPMNFRVRFITIVDDVDVATVTKTATYTDVNKNAWFETKVDPLLSLTFQKSGTEYSGFSEITVHAEGSRARSSSLPSDVVKGVNNFVDSGILKRFTFK